MKKIIAAFFITIFLATSSVFGGADEKKDHICFRVLDANQDGMVTFQEFEKHYGNDKEKFNTADGNSDGKLTHDEYHSILGHGSS